MPPWVIPCAERSEAKNRFSCYTFDAMPTRPAPRIGRLGPDAAPVENIKLVRAPIPHLDRERVDPVKFYYLPPGALAGISAHLKANGVEVDLDDLNIRFHGKNRRKTKVVEKAEESLRNPPRVWRHLLGDSDPALDRFGDYLCGLSDFASSRLVCISVSATTHEKSSLMTGLILARKLKEKYGPLVVLGGHGDPAHWELALMNRIADFAIVGPGEDPLLRLIRGLRAGGPLGDIPGLMRLENGRVVRSKQKSEEILIKEPSFDGLPLELYRWRDPYWDDLPARGELILPHRFISGCPFKCNFCVESGRDRLSSLSPVEVVDSLAALSERYETDKFFFLNSTLNYSLPFIQAVCDEIIKRRLKIWWTDCANFGPLTKDTLLKMRRAGAVRLTWGLETASPRLLKFIDKNIDAERAAEMLKISHEAGIWNGLEIINGLPSEQPSDVRQTIDFLNRNQEYIDTVYLNLFFVDPRSLMGQNPRKYGIRPTGKDAKNGRITFSGFDEIGGLKDADKRRQIADSYNKVRSSVKTGFVTPETTPVLLHLYSKNEEKRKIRELYDRWADHKRLNGEWNDYFWL